MLNLTSDSSINLNEQTHLNATSLPTKIIKSDVENMLFSPDNRNDYLKISNQSIERNDEFLLFKTNDKDNFSNPRYNINNSNINDMIDKQISSDIRPILSDNDKMKYK